MNVIIVMSLMITRSHKSHDGDTIQSIKSRQLLQCHNFQFRRSSYRGVIQARKIDNIRRVHHIHRNVVKR